MTFERIAVIILGIVLVGLLHIDRYWLLGRAVRTRGVVIGHRKTYDGGDVSYAAEIRFNDAHGRPVEFVDGMTFSAPHPDVGTTVPVVFDRTDSRSARRHRPFWRLFAYVALLLALGAISWRHLRVGS